METLDTQTWIILAVVIVLALAAIGAWYFYQKSAPKRSKITSVRNMTEPSLNSAAGPRANRNSRRAKSASSGSSLYHWRAPEAARFSEAWQALQSRFVDNPKGVVVQAEQLVRELMAKRGYPMGDFEQRAGDISVDHPDVVANYRAAQAIAVRDQRGSADTEELRKAVVHYRALFDELLEVRAPKARDRRSEACRVAMTKNS